MHESWLRTYLRYTEKHEAPELFHFWVGISLISAVLGRKTHINKGYYRLYPNFFVVLVAGSARCRKSTAIEIGANLLVDIPTVKVTAGKTSTERFIVDQIWDGTKTKTQPTSYVKADELSVFLTKDQQGDKLIDVLTKLFDCPRDFPYRTLSKGELILKEPYVTIIAGTQPASLAKVLPDTAFGGGFASRIMFVYQADTPRRNALPELSPEETLMGIELKKRLEEISEVEGEYYLVPDAKSYYIQWYGKMEAPDDDKLDGFFGRKADHVLRLCMILRASQGVGFDISLKHVNAAITAIDTIEALMGDAFHDVGKSPEHKNNADRVMRYLHKGGAQGLAHSQVLKKMYGYLDGQQFRILMDTLMQNGMVGKNPNAPRFYWCLCDACRALRDN